EAIEADDGRVEVAAQEEREPARNPDAGAQPLALFVRKTEERQVRGAALEVRLEGGELRRLVLVDVRALEVTRDRERERRERPEDERAPEAALGELAGADRKSVGW